MVLPRPYGIDAPSLGQSEQVTFLPLYPCLVVNQLSAKLQSYEVIVFRSGSSYDTTIILWLCPMPRPIGAGHIFTTLPLLRSKPIECKVSKL